MKYFIFLEHSACFPIRKYFSLRKIINENETLVIATHGILKKSQKTPSKEIYKAEEIRKNYLKSK